MPTTDYMVVSEERQGRLFTQPQTRTSYATRLSSILDLRYMSSTTHLGSQHSQEPQSETTFGQELNKLLLKHTEPWISESGAATEQQQSCGYLTWLSAQDLQATLFL